MDKKEYLSPISEILGLGNQDDLLTGGGGTLKNSGFEEEYNLEAPARSVKTSRLYI